MDTIYKLSDNKITPYISFDFKDLSVPKKYFEFDDPFAGFTFLSKKGFISIYKYMQEGVSSFVELRKQTADGGSTIIGLASNDVWKWFDVTKFDDDVFKGVFQYIDNAGNLVGLISADKLLSLYKSHPKLFKDDSMIKNLNEEANPFIIKI